MRHDTVLKYLDPLKQFKHKEVAEKTVILLALTTAHRLQTLVLINTDNISISNTSITIKIPDLIKISKIGNFPPEISLPYFKEEPSLYAAAVYYSLLQNI